MSRNLSVAATFLVLATAAALAAPAPLDLPPGAQGAAKVIDRATLEGPTCFLADDLLEGRGAAHRGDVLARNYVASVMELLGLEPAGPGGGWEQRFKIVGITTHAPETWAFRAGGKELALRFWAEFIAATGVQAPEVSVADAELVFVGYGIQAPEYNWDDFKGADLRGKMLVVMNNDPDWDPALFAGKRRLYYGRWMYKYENAARAGAAGAIIIHTTPSAGTRARRVRSRRFGVEGTQPRFQTGPARHPDLPGPHQHGQPRGDRQRPRDDPWQRSEAEGAGGRLFRPPRPPWDRKARRQG
jgi:hypothetical protein